MSEPKSILAEADELVNGDRAKAYGHPSKEFERVAVMWSAILGCTVEPRKVGLCMIALKISRECNAHKRDNLVDIAGYAQTVQMMEDVRA